MNLNHPFLSDEMLKHLKKKLHVKSVQAFLSTNDEVLIKITGLTDVIISTIKANLKVLYEHETISSREAHVKHVSSQENVSLHFGGLALPRGSIVQVSGPPAIGKTQFCNVVCVNLSALETASCFWIDTKLDFSGIRMLKTVLQVAEGEGEIMQRISVQNAFDAAELIEVLDYLCESQTLRCTALVIDSITCIFSLLVGMCYSTLNFYIEKIASCLRRIAIKHNTIIFFTSLEPTNTMDKRLAQWSTHTIRIDREAVDPRLLGSSLIRADPYRYITLASNIKGDRDSDSETNDVKIKVKIVDDGLNKVL